MADTVKIRWQAYLTTGHPLLSGDGRVLATIVGDDSGRHDALCGTSTAAANQAKYGDSAPQGPSPSGRELFTLAAAKHGLAPRDLPPSVSFFKGVAGKAGRRPGIHRQRRPGQGRRTAGRASADHPHRQRAAPGRPAPGVHLRPAAGARVAVGADDAGGPAPGTPRQRRTAPTSTPPTTWPQGGCDDMSTPRRRPRPGELRRGHRARPGRPARQPARSSWTRSSPPAPRGRPS